MNAITNSRRIRIYFRTVFDIEKAKTVLKEAGYSWDSDGRLQLPQ